MEKIPYHSLEESLEKIDEPNRRKCMLVLKDNKELFSKARGSKSKHQAWEGGYIDHITETMNLAFVFYDSLNELRRLPFSISDALLVLFLHDLEKPFKEKKGLELGLVNSSWKKDDDTIHRFKEDLFEKYGFVLTKEQLNALNYVEGENKDYHPTERRMNELAAFCHICDIWSARGWHDFPKKRPASW